MGWEAKLYLIAVVLPSVLMYFVLWARAKFLDKTEGRELPKLHELRRPEVVVPLLLSAVLVLAALTLVDQSERVIERETRQRLWQCLKKHDWVDAFDKQRIPRLDSIFFFIYFPTTWIMDSYAARRYQRDKSIGQREVVLFWIVSSFIYWWVSGVGVARMLEHYRVFANLCGTPTP